jgi:hypothetical protein
MLALVQRTREPWDTRMLLKMMVGALGSPLIASTQIEVLIHPFGPIRTHYGMKPRAGRTPVAPE